jgi:hypothetical protein
MSRARRVAFGVGAAAVAGLAAVGIGLAVSPAGAAADPSAGASSGVSTGAGQHGVPAVVRVPDGNRRIATFSARGVQTYQCTAGAFVFVQPDAILSIRGRAEILHSRGPVWTSVLDGSSVTGATVASSPRENAIPELLLRSTGNRAPGLLGTVRFIQRLDTRGGLAPAGACTTEGATVSVPYAATYAFWVAA